MRVSLSRLLGFGQKRSSFPRLAMMSQQQHASKATAAATIKPYSTPVETTGSLDDTIAPIRRQPTCAQHNLGYTQVKVNCRMSGLARPLTRLAQLLDLANVTTFHLFCHALLQGSLLAHHSSNTLLRFNVLLVAMLGSTFMTWSRKVRNSEPCRGFVKKSANISLVGNSYNTPGGTNSGTGSAYHHRTRVVRGARIETECAASEFHAFTRKSRSAQGSDHQRRNPCQLL
jgi:hypothetical protein